LGDGFSEPGMAGSFQQLGGGIKLFIT